MNFDPTQKLMIEGDNLEVFKLLQKYVVQTFRIKGVTSFKTVGRATG